MKVLYEDNHVIAVIKPHNTPVMGDSSGDECMLDMVKSYIKEKYSKPGNVFIGLVHRLDRPTGGTMVFARTSKGASRISEQIRVGRFEKKYIALVEGKLSVSSGKMEAFLLKDVKSNKSRIVAESTPGAKKAVLEYIVLKNSKEHTLVEIRLVTGRHHQIRVQFSNAGHPVAGDLKYGSKKGSRSIALWSHEIKFYKPVGDEPVKVLSEPDYCSEPWSRMS